MTEFSSGAPRHHKTDEKMNMGQQTNLHHPLGRVPRDFIGDDIVKTILNNSDKFVPDKNLEHSATSPHSMCGSLGSSSYHFQRCTKPSSLDSGTLSQVP